MISKNQSNFYKLITIAFIFGLNFPASKYSIDYLGVWNFRFITATASCLSLLVMFRKSIATLFKSKKRDLMLVSILAIPNIFLVPTLNNYSLKLTESSEALVLVYSMPIMVSIFTMIRNGRLNGYSFIASLLTAGAMLILLGFRSLHVGEYVIILSALIWAIGTFTTELTKVEISPGDSTLLQFLISFILVSIFYFLLGNHSLEVYVKNPIPLLVAVYVGAIGNAYVFVLWFTLLADKGAEFVSYASLLSLIFGISISVFWLGETLSSSMIISSLMMLISVWIVTISKNKMRRGIMTKSI